MSTPNPSQQKTVGVFEAVSFPEFRTSPVIAKLDTGAYSGALHCSSIIETNNESGAILEFCPLGQEKPVRCEEYAIRYVKSSNGQREKRYFVETFVRIAGKSYPIVLSLADRSAMKWQVLIGRKFLKQHSFIVDARRPSQYGKLEESS